MEKGILNDYECIIALILITEFLWLCESLMVQPWLHFSWGRRGVSAPYHLPLPSITCRPHSPYYSMLHNVLLCCCLSGSLSGFYTKFQQTCVDVVDGGGLHYSWPLQTGTNPFLISARRKQTMSFSPVWTLYNWTSLKSMMRKVG